MVKVETEAPALWRKPPETANPTTLDKCAPPRLYCYQPLASLVRLVSLAKRVPVISWTYWDIDRHQHLLVASTISIDGPLGLKHLAPKVLSLGSWSGQAYDFTSSEATQRSAHTHRQAWPVLPWRPFSMRQ